MIPKITEVSKYLKETKFEVYQCDNPDRVALLTEDCTIKIALTGKGLSDNIKESQIDNVLAPFCLRVIETNGFISICEPFNPWTNFKEDDTSANDSFYGFTKDDLIKMGEDSDIILDNPDDKEKGE